MNGKTKDMRTLLLIPLCLWIDLANAEFMLSPGLGGQFGYKSDKVLDETQALSDTGGFGIQGTMEFHLFNFLGLAGGIGYSALSGKIDYKYTDKDLPSNTATISDLKFGGIDFRVWAGPRISILSGDTLRLFLGAGVSAGAVAFGYDEEEFKTRNGGSIIGYKSAGAAGYSGKYLESGLALFWRTRHGIQLIGRWHEQKLGKLETLNDEKLKISYLEATVSYVFRVGRGSNSTKK